MLINGLQCRRRACAASPRSHWGPKLRTRSSPNIRILRSIYSPPVYLFTDPQSRILVYFGKRRVPSATKVITCLGYLLPASGCHRRKTSHNKLCLPFKFSFPSSHPLSCISIHLRNPLVPFSSASPSLVSDAFPSARARRRNPIAQGSVRLSSAWISESQIPISVDGCFMRMPRVLTSAVICVCACAPHRFVDTHF